MDDVIMTAINILCEINYQNCTIQWIPTGYNVSIIKSPLTQYTNYHCKKNLFYCYYLCLPNSTLSFLYKTIVFKPVFVHFQTKDSDTHVYAHSWSSNYGHRNQQNKQLLGPFLLKHFLY